VKPHWVGFPQEIPQLQALFQVQLGLVELGQVALELAVLELVGLALAELGLVVGAILAELV